MALQRTRPIAVVTPLGEDALFLRGMRGAEHLGRLFEYELSLLSADESIPADDLLGQNVTVRLELGDDKQRFFNGYVSRFAQTGRSTDYATYQATVRPWLWFLTRRADCRIFQDMTVPEIVMKVFREAGFTDFEESLSGSYGKWEFCVQYRETDFNFVSRLMEHEGIYYYFKHDDGKHTLVLADSYDAHALLPGYEEVPYFPPGDNVREEHVYDWSISREVQPGMYSLRDFDFEKPSVDLAARSRLERKHANAAFEIYDYPGEYLEESDGKFYVRTRIEELQWQHEQVEGIGTVRGFQTGGLFALAGYPRPDQNREYLLVGASHDLRSSEFETGGGGGEATCTCRFTAIESKTPYRSPRITPKPLIQGPQTAIVVGKWGEEIWTDKYGRVKVQFHWDRLGTMDENSSCWVRVAQVWAGKTWGGIQIPRIGQEVVVEFLEGDPDCPIITGRVYNAEAMPPYGLPASATQSGIKSRTTKGGTGSNFNELRFEDKHGSEEVFLHAEKDWKIHVKNGESETVGASVSTSAGGSISRNAGADHSRTADQNIKDKAGVNITTNSGKDMSLQAGGAYELHTNLGIHLKAMNFVAALIESGAKQAAEAIKKGAMATGVAAAVAGHDAASGAGGGGAALKAGFGAQGAQAAAGAEKAGMQALAAMSPAIEAGAAELGKLSDAASQGMTNLEGPAATAIAKMDALKTAVESGASPEAVATAFMAAADAAMTAWKDAAKIVEGLLPKIPSIVMWAMKDIQAQALWSMQLSTKVKSISIEAKNKDIDVKAKQNLSLEASDKNLNVKAGKKDILITAKEKVSIKAEEKDLVIEAGKTRVIVKSAKQMVFKCGSASIAMKESGDILVKGAKITLKGTGPIEAKGNPIKLN